MILLKNKSKILIILFLSCLPLIVGFHLSDFRAVCNYFSSILVFFLPYILINNLKFRKIYWAVFSFVLLTWSMTETLLLLQEHAELNYLALKIFYESNPRELLEYFTAIIPIWATGLSIVIIIALIKILQKPKHYVDSLSTKQTNIKNAICILIFIIYLLTIQSTADAFGIFKNEYKAQRYLNKYYHNLNNRDEVLGDFFAKNPYNYQKKQDKNTYVIVIGESTSRHHMSLYQYFRNTNPLLSQRNDLTVYSDVISTNTSTVECLGKCLTIGGNRFERDLSSPNIIDLANKVGIKTFWISNQNKDALFYNSITLATKSAKESHFIQKASSNSYDENILPYLNEALKDTSSNKLIILQLIGTHFEYNKRYPKKFEIFKIDSELKKRFIYANTEEKLQKINGYDNAVLYNDFVLNLIFEELTKYKNTENISAIYFSDHADEVYDQRDFVGHTPQGNSAFLHEIPFITWNIQAKFNQKKALQMDIFANSALDWMNIKTTNSNPQKSLFSPYFKPEKRYLGNGQLYQK